MRLLERRLVSRKQTCVRFWSGPRRGETRFGLQRAKGHGGKFNELGELDISRGRDDDVIGRVPGAEAVAARQRG